MGHYSGQGEFNGHEVEMKFIVNGMLGRLAKWLRILGYDTTYSPHLDDDQLVRQARAEGRLLLTRDTGLARRRGSLHFDLDAHLDGDGLARAVRQGDSPDSPTIAQIRARSVGGHGDPPAGIEAPLGR